MVLITALRHGLPHCTAQSHLLAQRSAVADSVQKGSGQPSWGQEPARVFMLYHGRRRPHPQRRAGQCTLHIVRRQRQRPLERRSGAHLRSESVSCFSYSMFCWLGFPGYKPVHTLPSQNHLRDYAYAHEHAALRSSCADVGIAEAGVQTEDPVVCGPVQMPVTKVHAMANPV